MYILAIDSRERDFLQEYIPQVIEFSYYIAKFFDLELSRTEFHKAYLNANNKCYYTLKDLTEVIT